MKITHHVASEHAIYKSGTLFVGLCVIFTLLVSTMSIGRYGYAPNLDFFWAPIVLILFWQLKAEIEIVDAGYLYSVKWLGITLKKDQFNRMEWKPVGKIGVLQGEKNGRLVSTIISIENGKTKQVYLEKLIKSLNQA